MKKHNSSSRSHNMHAGRLKSRLPAWTAQVDGSSLRVGIAKTAWTAQVSAQTCIRRLHRSQFGLRPGLVILLVDGVGRPASGTPAPKCLASTAGSTWRMCESTRHGRKAGVHMTVDDNPLGSLRTLAQGRVHTATNKIEHRRRHQ